MDPRERHADLMRQGFMKPRKERRKVKPKIVACEACMNWHPERKHTASKEERETNLRELRNREDNSG